MLSLKFSDKVFAFTQENVLFSAPCHVLVAVSGGADSMSLLHTLLNWPVDGLQVSAVHIHHGLRGEYADRDERFVRDYCDKHSVKLIVYHENVAAYAEYNGLSIEEAGRRLRYARFEEARASVGADVIVTAHTASDRAETTLMRIIRGTGVDGLVGIPMARGRICRPLLSCTRAEVEQYCAECGIPYVNDESNVDVAFTRNRIRLQVLPQLTAMNPSVEEALLRLADHARDDADALLTMALRHLQESDEPYGYRIDTFIREHVAVRRRMIMLMMRDVGVPSIEEAHVVAAESAVEVGAGSVLLPGGFVFAVSQGVAQVCRDTGGKHPDPVRLSELPTFGMFGEVKYRITVERADSEIVHNLFSNTMLDYDKIEGNLQLRCRCEGDAIHPVGRGVGKTLKKLMNECGIPTPQREQYPVLCDDNGIVMVPGYAVDERVKVTDATKHLLVWQTDELTT